MRYTLLNLSLSITFNQVTYLLNSIKHSYVIQIIFKQTQMGTTSPGQSGPGSDGYEGVLPTP